MSANPAICKEQLARCSGLDLWQNLDATAKRELLKTLSHESHSEKHAEAIVDAWLRTSPRRPTPADLVRLAGEVADPAAVIPEGCQICGCSPWLITDCGAKRCDCPRGQFLAARDAQRGVGVAK